jgi:hypothetical protein
MRQHISINHLAMKRITILPAIFIGLTTMSLAQTETELKLVGVYKEIDVARHNRAVETLHDTNQEEKKQIVDSILQQPNRYNPPVLYALSRELFQQGRKDEAIYWFYLGQLRARYDANRCVDISARQGVAVLNGVYGPDINKYAFENVELLKTTVERVLAFVRANEEEYDQRWINLHGMGAVIASMGDTTQVPQLSEPRERWREIKVKTLDDYSTGFQEALEMLKKRK